MRAVLLWGIRIKAPTPQILPNNEIPWGALLSRWDENRRALEAWLLTVDPEVIRTPRFRHPITGWMDVPQALTFVGDHLDHHLIQISRIERDFR